MASPGHNELILCQIVAILFWPKVFNSSVQCSISCLISIQHLVSRNPAPHVSLQSSISVPHLNLTSHVLFITPVSNIYTSSTFIWPWTCSVTVWSTTGRVPTFINHQSSIQQGSLVSNWLISIMGIFFSQFIDNETHEWCYWTHDRRSLLYFKVDTN